MIKKEEVSKIGIFNKPHGIHGELSFTFTFNVFEVINECNYLVCSMDGILVPFFIENFRFRSETTALVKLEDINSAEQARIFTNVEVYFPSCYIDEKQLDDLSWDYFIGYELVDNVEGTVGKIIDVDTSTINTLFIVETEEGELLIPAQEEFIMSFDRDQKIILLDLPEGLLTMDSSEDETY